jgi:hypothetical protein
MATQKPALTPGPVTQVPNVRQVWTPNRPDVVPFAPPFPGPSNAPGTHPNYPSKGGR